MRLALLLITISACQQSSTVTSSISEIQSEESPVKESWGVHTYMTTQPMGTSDSYPRMEIIADYVAWYEGEEESYQLMKQEENPVRAYLYENNGDTTAIVVATTMCYFESDERLEMIGQVSVLSSDGTRLETEELEWYGSERVIRTDEFVKIVTPTEEVEGYDLLATEDLKTYSLGRFTARVNIDQ